MMHRVRVGLRRLGRREQGQSLVEFALLIPVMLIFVVAVIDFGLLLFQYQVTTNAAREGARRAVLADETIDDEAVRASIRAALSPIADPADISFVTEDLGGCGALAAPSIGHFVVYECGWSGTPPDVPDASVGIATEYETALLGRFLHLATGSMTFPIRTRMVMRNE